MLFLNMHYCIPSGLVNAWSYFALKVALSVLRGVCLNRKNIGKLYFINYSLENPKVPLPRDHDEIRTL